MHQSSQLQDPIPIVERASHGRAHFIPPDTTAAGASSYHGGAITGVARKQDVVTDSQVQMKLCIEGTEGNLTEVLTTVRRWSRSSATGRCGLRWSRYVGEQLGATPQEFALPRGALQVWHDRDSARATPENATTEQRPSMVAGGFSRVPKISRFSPLAARARMMRARERSSTVGTVAMEVGSSANGSWFPWR